MGNPNEANDPSSTTPPSSPMLDRSMTDSFYEGEYQINFSRGLLYIFSAKFIRFVGFFFTKICVKFLPYLMIFPKFHSIFGAFYLLRSTWKKPQMWQIFEGKMRKFHEAEYPFHGKKILFGEIKLSFF